MENHVRFSDSTRRVALVTGVGGGIGAAIAVQLAAMDCDIIVHRMRPVSQEIEQLQERIKAHGARCVSITGDLGDTFAAEQFVAAAIERLGGIDVLVNSAAWDPGCVELEQCTPEFLDHMWGVNVRAPLLLIRSMVRYLQVRRLPGCIVNISSIHAWHSVAGHVGYAASKGALEALTRQLAVELGPIGIRINAVAPAFIEVSRTTRGRSASDLSQVAQRTPLQRNGQPEDVAALVGFLCSEQARHITGQVYAVDGGTSCVLATHPLHPSEASTCSPPSPIAEIKPNAISQNAGKEGRPASRISQDCRCFSDYRCSVYIVR